MQRIYFVVFLRDKKGDSFFSVFSFRIFLYKFYSIKKFNKHKDSIKNSVLNHYPELEIDKIVLIN